jgi:hypothetical protein
MCSGLIFIALKGGEFMLSCKIVCDALNDLGVSCAPKNIDLDGGKRWGILCETGDALGQLIVPVDDVLEFAGSVEEAASFVKEYVDGSKLPEGVDYDSYLNRDFLLENVKLTLGERHWLPYLQRNSKLPGIIESMYIGGMHKRDIYWVIDISQDILDRCGVTLEECWERAEQNTYQRKHFVTRSVYSMLETRGISAQNDKNPVKLVYIITGDNSGIKGAVHIQSYDCLKQFISEQFFTSEIVAYPQSENNFLVAPYTKETFATLRAIAESDGECQWLSDFIYVIDLKDRFWVKNSLKIVR